MSKVTATIATALLITACGFDRGRVDQERCAQFAAAPGCDTTDVGSDTGASDALQDGPLDSAIDAPTDTPGSDDGSCPGSENACGGCAALTGIPDGPCAEATCGTWQCATPEALVCVGRPRNACEGCAELEGAPGDPCGGTCGATLACVGTELLACEGPLPNQCGGCTEPVDVDPGDTCACGGEALVEEHLWTCSANNVLCTDGNSESESPHGLPDSSDTMVDTLSIRGAIAPGETHDYFQVFVRDQGSNDDGLLPDISLVGLSANLNLCAAWIYEGGRFFDPICRSSSSRDTDDGLTACCSERAGTDAERIEILGWLGGRLDQIPGENNDNGWLLMWVESSEPDECATYELRYRF